jgi:uncharacterized membrane protein YczE
VFTRGHTRAEVRRRLPRLVLAFALLGLAIAMTVRADLGLSPWDVLHQGLARQVGLPIGTTGILVGLVVLVAWIPLRERIGIATLLNVVLIGTFIDLSLLALPDDPSDPVRWAYLVVGTFLIGPGAALYLSCGLGAGPRDGVMTALVDRGWSLRVIRTVMEVSVLATGWLLGGTVGLGTVLFAFTVGPNLHFFIDRWTLPDADDVPVALAD